MPGPQPQYQPTFSAEDLNEANKVLRRRTSRHGEARRARLAILLSEDPALQNPEAGRIIGLHENSVRYWRKRWVEEGFRLEDKPHTGRPRFFPPSDHHDN